MFSEFDGGRNWSGPILNSGPLLERNERWPPTRSFRKSFRRLRDWCENADPSMYGSAWRSCWEVLLPWS